MAEKMREVFSAKMAEKMKEENMKQIELARRIGVSRGSVSNWLAGRNFPDMESIASICKELNCTPSDLLGDNAMEEIIGDGIVREVTNIMGYLSHRDKEILLALARQMKQIH